MEEYRSPPKNYMTPPKESVGKQLRKVAILKSHKKYKEAKEVATSLRSKFKVSEIAALYGESMHAIYRLLSPERKRRLQKHYVKKLTQEDKNEVIKICNDDEVSYSLPDIKYANLRFMHFTLREAYAVYVRKCRHQRIVAETTFERLKPKNVRTVQETPLCDARCEYCANFGKTRDVLIVLGMKGIPRNHSEAIEATWCPFRTEHYEVTSQLKKDKITSRFKKEVQHDLPNKKCVQRKCVTCGVTKYERDLIHKNRIQMRQHKAVTWRQWDKVKIGEKNGKAVYRTELVVQNGSIVNLMKLYMEQLQKMSLHQFFKIWQLRNFNLTMNNLKPGQVLFVHDFQQNLLLLTQDETSASHWDHPQLTIHPTAVYYRCSKCQQLVKEDIIHITMDKGHDKYAVNKFISTTVDHLKKKDVAVNEIIEFTDHMSSQYKSRFTFYYMTLLDIPCTRHYFGVKHGKGPSDRAGANFKRKIRTAVRAGKILLNADTIEEYCKENYDHQVECGYDVKERDVNRKRDVNEKLRDAHSLFKVYNHRTIERPRKELTLKTLEGSRDYVHAVCNTGVKGVVEYRYFDCGCLSCTTHTDRCSQNEYADRWEQFHLLPRKKIDLSADNSD